MSPRLPKLILLSVICFLLSVNYSYAQDLIPTITTSPQLNPQGNVWDDFLSTLLPGQFKQIPDTLQQINCASLPAEACDSLKSTTSNTTGSLINPQANDDTAKKEVVSNAAGQYTIASGVHTPPEVSNASTNIISDFFAKLADWLDIFKKGETEAKNSVTNLPQEVKDQLFNPNTAASGNSNVLGAQAQGAAMDRALPMVQCGALPAGLCGSDNKPNVVQPNL